MPCDHPITVVSLFDGIAGFPLACTLAGMQVVATVEIDKAAAGVAALHFPDAAHFIDVTKVTADDLISAGFCPDCGIICAGWPCQDLSLAGRRLGLGGARSGLFFEIVRLAQGVRARRLILENVPGLLSAVCSCPGLDQCGTGCTDPHPVRGGACGPSRCMELHGGAMGAVLGSLVELGYGVAYRVLDAQHFGVPQRRRRVVIVGCLGDWAAPAEILLEPDGGNGDSAPGGETRPDAAAGSDERTAGARVVNALTSNMAGAGGGVDDNTAQGGHLITSALTARKWSNGSGGAAGDEVQNLIGFDAAQITSGENRSNPQPGDPQPPLAATSAPHVAYQFGSNVGPMGTLRAGNGGGASGGTPFVTHALTAEGADASEDGTGRGTPITVDSAAVRRLTPVECERLQGYPDQWTARRQDLVADGNRWVPANPVSSGVEQADAPRYRQLGNSIAVPVFAWVAIRVQKYS